MPLEEHEVQGYIQYSNLFSKLSAVAENRIVTLFFASFDSNGKTWCGDCEEALPIINEAVAVAKQTSTSVSNYVFVSIEREDWRNKDSDFRQHCDLKLTNIPTLILWEGNKERKRLTEKECSNQEHVLSLFQ